MTRTFAIMYSYTPDNARQDATRPAHLEHLRRLVDDGTLLASGPWGPDDDRGGLLVSTQTTARRSRRSWTGIHSLPKAW